MPKSMLLKNIFIFFLSVVFLVVSGCKGMKKPSEFVESLRNPTSFPERILPEIKNIDEIVNENTLAEDENIMIIPVDKDKSSSIYLFQIRENAEIDSHYHKFHDVIMYINKGSGILVLEDSRHSVKEGIILSGCVLLGEVVELVLVRVMFCYSGSVFVRVACFVRVEIGMYIDSSVASFLGSVYWLEESCRSSAIGSV